MKKIVLLILPALMFTSCKKVIEKAQEQVVIDAITTGYWKVTKYTKANTELTSDFAAYKFQFKENNTVDAVKNNVFDKSGSWQGDATAMTITSSFGSAAAPLSLLNGTWKVTKNSTVLVEANQILNGEYCSLRLDKE